MDGLLTEKALTDSTITISFLPSYWMGYGAQTENWVWMIPGIFVAAIWVLVLYRRYAK